MKDTHNTIFGYSWEEIQARQQGTYRPKPIVHTPPALANDADYKALERAGSMDALRQAGMFGIVDRLSRSPLAHCDTCGRTECAPWHTCQYNNAV